jgi:hypothetical protein
VARRQRARGLTHYGDRDFSLFIRGAFARGPGLTADDLARPIIAIAQTFSDFNPAVATSASSGKPSSGASSGGLPLGRRAPARVPDRLTRRDLPSVISTRNG